MVALQARNWNMLKGDETGKLDYSTADDHMTAGSESDVAGASDAEVLNGVSRMDMEEVEEDDTDLDIDEAEFNNAVGGCSDTGQWALGGCWWGTGEVGQVHSSGNSFTFSVVSCQFSMVPSAPNTLMQ